MVLHVSLAYGQIFLICFFGQYQLDNFERLNDSICMCEWYRFPIGTQRILDAMLVAAQRPVYIRGFGSSACMRESFKEVQNKMFLQVNLKEMSICNLLFQINVIFLFHFTDDEFNIFIFYDVASALSVL